MGQKYVKGDFTQVPNISILRGLPGLLQSVYLWICQHSDKQGECFPSIPKIAKDAGVSESTVIRSIKKLCGLGILEKTKRRKEGTKENTSNLYGILLRPPKKVSVSDDESKNE